jgi:ABC-type sugar transport system ATPase subunit
MIEMTDVFKTYSNGVLAINGINVKIDQGEFVYVVGPSGAGKSTFIKMMYREERPTDGKIVINGINLAKLREKKVPYLRRSIGVVFQDFKLLPKLTVFENIAFALEVIGEKLWPIIKGIIMTNIENNQSIIIEGCYLLPHYINDFKKTYSEKIISVFLGFSANYIKENFTSNIVKHRNAIETRNYPEERTITECINEHDEFKTKCAEHGVEYFEIDKEYEQEMIKVYNFIETQKRIIDSKFKVGDDIL